MTEEVRPLTWQQDHLLLLDQTLLPLQEVYVEIRDVDQLVDAIVRLVVRGAPALGATGGYGVALAMVQGEREGWSADRLELEIDRIRDARPTAVNLAWGVERVRPRVSEGLAAALAEADAIWSEDAAGNRRMGEVGADWIEAHVERRPIRIITHCNTGPIATTEWGTALGVIRTLHERGLVELVYADETRPLLQGSRLTAWELGRAGIPYQVEADGAAASTILRGLVDVALIGADRIAANGDTANKVGSLTLALACKEAGIPFLTVAPTTTVDLSTKTGEDIHIELRDGDEVLTYAGQRVAPLDAEGFNPAFDVTPARFISAIITEVGAIEVAAGQTPQSRL